MDIYTHPTFNMACEQLGRVDNGPASGAVAYRKGGVSNPALHKGEPQNPSEQDFAQP